MVSTTTPTTAGDRPAEDTGHEPDTFFVNYPGPRQVCGMRCSCGVSFRAASFEAAGAAFDAHVRGVSQ